jgi:hypothetical protein
VVALGGERGKTLNKNAKDLEILVLVNNEVVDDRASKNFKLVRKC